MRRSQGSAPTPASEPKAAPSCPAP
jgi:hypothetical protein